MRTRRVGTLRVVVSRSTIRAEALSHRAVVWAGEMTYESPGDLADAIARLAAEPPLRCGRLAVELERPPVQSRTLKDLPPVKDRELPALVAHQASRFFRRNGHPLVTDAVWIGTGATRVARAAAIEEPIAEAIVSGARAAGLTLISLGPAAAEGPLLLLPGVERAARERARRRSLHIAGLAVAGLWLSVVVGFYARLALERRAVERELARLKQPLAAVLEARRTLHSAEATILAVRGVEQHRGRALAVLGAVAAALPDSAVITSLTWNADDAGVVSGSAKHAASVLARLERSLSVLRPRFEGPIVRETIAGRQWERFTIVFGDARP